MGRCSALVGEALLLSCMILCFVGGVQVFFIRKVNRLSSGYWIACLGTLFMHSLSVYISERLTGQPGTEYHIALRIACFFDYFFAILIAYFFTLYFCYTIDPKHKNRKMMMFARILSTVYLIVLTVSQFTDFLYTVDEDNQYLRNPGYVTILIMGFIIIVANAVMLFRNKRKLTRGETVAFWIFVLVPANAVVLQYLIPNIRFISFGITLAAIVMYVFIASEQVQQHYLNMQENDKLKTDVMLSQIQPHFLYNSLTAIKYLCRKDPALAEQAITEFSRYIRGNMDSLTAEPLIEFRQELSHAKAYLSMEKLRFGDELTVDYQIEAEDFDIPPLTLQPMVENAVRHGIRESAEGKGTVTISTKEYPDRYEVIVSDDGAGFDPSALPDDGRRHVGISNVRERLERVCDGRLEIRSAPGQGTVVVITIMKDFDVKESMIFE